MKTKFLKKHISLMFAGLFSLALFTQCDSPNTANDTEVGEETEEAADAVGDQMESMSNDFQAEQQEWTTKIENKITELESDMENASAEAKPEIQEKIDKLDQQMDKLENSTEDSWQDVKGEVNQAFEEVDAEIDSNS